MAHEITASDGLVLAGKRAWHGLGRVVENAPTPREALQMAGLAWDVEQWPLVAVGEAGARLSVESHVQNVRSDNKEPLAVVTSRYTPVQNAKLAEIATALAEGGDVVRCESAGSIRGGRKAWFLLRGASFSVRKSDEMCPYILLANAHDGTQALRAICTTVRVVCSNSLHMSLGGNKAAGYTFRHTSGISVKAEEIKSALGLYEKAAKVTREKIEALSAKEIARADVQAFFVEAYSRDFGAIPANPKTEAEKSSRERAVEAFNAYSRRWDKEASIAGNTAWNAFNAYS